MSIKNPTPEIWIRINNIVLFLLPLLLGVSAFFIIFGPRILYPTNIGWINNSLDPIQHYLGWLFYRYSEWSFPLGLNPKNGLIDGTIVYSDSIPLLALIFKPFSSILSEPFQYLGIWTFLCVVLQSLIGWKLIGLISKNTYIRIFGTGLLIFSPPMLARSGLHTSLCSHFLIIAALYAYLMPENNKQKRSLWWAGITITSALIHPYLLAITGLLWITNVASLAIGRKKTLKKSLIEFFIILTGIILACWQTGYFTVGESGAFTTGYGTCNMNLLTMINPASWSYVLKNIFALRSMEEFNYLGLGIIILALTSIPALINNKTTLTKQIKKKHLLLITLILLTLFAITNNITIGNWTLKLPIIPQKLNTVMGVFRASPRMFWPAFYMIIFVVIFITVRINKKHNAIALLAIAFFIQAIDTSAVWLHRRQKLFMSTPSSNWITPLESNFWIKAAYRYKNVLIILPYSDNYEHTWKTFSTYAANNNMGTNIFYLARYSGKNVIKSRNKIITAVTTGKFDKNSLYIITDQNRLNLIATKIDPKVDLFTKIDGFSVLAPNWHSNKN